MTQFQTCLHHCISLQSYLKDNQTLWLNNAKTSSPKTLQYIIDLSTILDLIITHSHPLNLDNMKIILYSLNKLKENKSVHVKALNLPPACVNKNLTDLKSSALNDFNSILQLCPQI